MTPTRRGIFGLLAAAVGALAWMRGNAEPSSRPRPIRDDAEELIYEQIGIPGGAQPLRRWMRVRWNGVRGSRPTVEHADSKLGPWYPYTGDELHARLTARLTEEPGGTFNVRFDPSEIVRIRAAKLDREITGGGA